MVVGVTLVGYAIGIIAGGWLVGWILRVLRSEEASEPGLGRVIGWFERFLIVTFVLVNQWVAIGFIVAAKSLLRFGGTRNDRQFAEYVLVGTLASVSVAVLVGIGLDAAIGWLGHVNDSGGSLQYIDKLRISLAC
ncbi:MAG: hypothetical protein ACOC8E_08405 [Planctomycetota bacterium]